MLIDFGSFHQSAYDFLSHLLYSLIEFVISLSLGIESNILLVFDQ